MFMLYASSAVASPSTSSVEPPPRSMTSRGDAGIRHTRGGAEERELRFLAALDHLRGDPQALVHSGRELIAVGHVAAGRCRDEPQSVRSVTGHDLRVLVADREGPCERLRSELAGAVDSLAQSGPPASRARPP